MEPARLAVVVGALLVALVLAWLPWRGRLDRPLARVGLAARAAGWLALALLLIDPGVSGRSHRGRPLVLLDNSVSMHSATAPGDSLRALAAARGDVMRFGELAPDVPGGVSRLGPLLAAATSAGRPVEVVTDGEIADAASIPADLLAQATLTVVPRRGAPDVALSAVRMPDRIAVGDTLTVEVEARVSAGWPEESLTVVLRDGDRELLTGRVATGGAVGRFLIRLEGVLPADLSGDRWLTLTRRGAPDAEPGDDSRERLLRVTPTPGIVVLATTPDWDARELLRTLMAVSRSAVRGYVQLSPGRWYRADRLTPVSAAEVARAAAGADLVAVRGDTTPWRRAGRSRLLWPRGGSSGDWYAAAGAASPVSGAFGAVATESLPPLVGVSPAGDGSWQGMVARRARRGDATPVMVGRTDGGRTVVLSADGFYQWALRGGEAEQAWRSLVAEATSWLLATPAGGGPAGGVPAVEPVTAVTEQGRPVVFRRTGGDDPTTPITFRTDQGERIDTLTWDPNGHADVALPVGHYRYDLPDGSGGVVAVEPFAAELFPGPPRLTSRAAQIAPTPLRRSLRDLLWLAALAVLGFAAEWMIRRRLGLP